jgi:hypothetical protein
LNNNYYYCLHPINLTTHFKHKINNLFTITLHHLHYLHIIYVIYTSYNRDQSVAQLKTSFFLVFSLRFKDFYREFLKLIHRCTLELIHKCALLFTKINIDVHHCLQRQTKTLS